MGSGRLKKVKSLGAPSPTRPSTASRKMSAWPVWRAYSSIKSKSMSRTVGVLLSGQVNDAGPSSPRSSITWATSSRDRSTASRQTAGIARSVHRPGAPLPIGIGVEVNPSHGGPSPGRPA